jgi:hypothetical protein
MLEATGAAIVIVDRDDPPFDGLDQLAADGLVPFVQVIVHYSLVFLTIWSASTGARCRAMSEDILAISSAT